MTVDALEVLATKVSTGGQYKPFGEFTLAEVRARAEELSAATGWGPTAKVGAVARAWRDLAAAMEGAGAQAVAELPEETVLAYGERTWVVPPGGGLLA